MVEQKHQFSRIIKAITHPELSYQYVLSEIYERKRQELFKRNFIRGEKKNAVLIASYPKSGNTLFRLIWLNLINLLELHQEKITFEVLDEYLPSDQFYTDLDAQWEFSSLPCLLKTHRVYTDDFSPLKRIHLYRNPFDVMVSSYHYFSKRKSGPNNNKLSYIEKKCFNSLVTYTGTFSEYLKDNVSNYCDHFISWAKHNDAVIRYESLISEANERYVVYFLKKLNISIDEEVIKKALGLSDKKNYKGQNSSKMAALQDMDFVRDGSIGQWQDYYSKKDMEMLERIFTEKGMFDSHRFSQTYQADLSQWQQIITDFSKDQ